MERDFILGKVYSRALWLDLAFTTRSLPIVLGIGIDSFDYGVRLRIHHLMLLWEEDKKMGGMSIAIATDLSSRALNRRRLENLHLMHEGYYLVQVSFIRLAYI